MNRFSLDANAIENIFSRMAGSIADWMNFIDVSFLPNKMKEEYKNLISQKAEQIEL
ncbi:MAG: hypothetical protein WD077_04955 [Bacteroidia bacterium]